MSRGVEEVRRALEEMGFEGRVRELPESTRTVREAAVALGCREAEIAKSVVFRDTESGEPVLAVMSGANRVDTAKLSELVGARVERPDAAFVREATGFVIGGVAPVAHRRPLAIFLDRDLFQYPTVWASAGGPFSLLELSPRELEQATGGRVVDVREAGGGRADG